MTITGIMTQLFLSVLSTNGIDKAELSAQEARNVQASIMENIGIEIGTDDIRIQFKSFATKYRITHSRKPAKRSAWPELKHAEQL